MSEIEENNENTQLGFFTRNINKIKLWFLSLGADDDLPEKDTSDYVDLEAVDYSKTELLIISSHSYTFISYF